MNKFIIDTNTLISSLLIRNSTSFKAMEIARSKGPLLFSQETFLEFELVLLRKKFDRYFSKEERLQIIEKTYNDALFVPVISIRLFAGILKTINFSIWLLIQMHPV